LMPSWKRRFFWNWMNFDTTAHLVVSLSRIQKSSSCRNSRRNCTYSTGIWTWMQILYYCVSEWHRKLIYAMYAAEVSWSTGRGILVMKTLKDRLIKCFKKRLVFHCLIFNCDDVGSVTSWRNKRFYFTNWNTGCYFKDWNLSI
jgi:hypothetical protein